MNILITGSAGFIGKHLVKKLAKNKKNKIFALDKNKTFFKEKNVKFIKKDLSEKVNLPKLKNVEFAYHLAGQSSAEKSEEDPVQDYKDNVLSTINFCRWAKNQKKLKVCFFSSSMAVYGDVVKKKIVLSPNSIYGYSKLIAEQIFLSLKNHNKVVKILRLFNVYGEGQNLLNMKQGMISIYLAQILSNKYKKIYVKGSLGRTRDLIHVEDVVNIMTSAKFIKNRKEIFDVGSGKEISVLQIIKKLKKIFKSNKKIKIQEQTKGDIFKSKMKDRFLKKIGLFSRISLEKRLVKMKNFYESNSNTYRKKK